jgi:hypothetical protein
MFFLADDVSFVFYVKIETAPARSLRLSSQKIPPFAIADNRLSSDSI